jgi:pyridoxamine 5'-phosphate oxidase-like protein
MPPTAELLDLPKEYGRATRKLAWATVRAELERATQYWLATRRPDGRAHVVPLDGVWLDDVCYYGGSEQAAHYRNALADPGVVMHLPDPVKAVIVEGDARLAHPSPELARRLDRLPHGRHQVPVRRAAALPPGAAAGNGWTGRGRAG